jgi:hypothetical protein
MEEETAVCKWDMKDQPYIIYQATKNLQRLIKVSYNKGVNPNTSQEEGLINDIDIKQSTGI